MTIWIADCSDCQWQDIGPKNKIEETADDHDSSWGHKIYLEPL